MNRLPLSLLDLLACSFGGVILLFFVTIIVWEQMAGDSEAVSLGQSSGNSLFVLLVAPEDSSTLLFDHLADVSWKMEGSSSSKNQWQQDITPQYAVFYTQNLPTGTKLTLSGVRPNVRVAVRIFEGGETRNFEQTSKEGCLHFNERMLKQ